MSLKQIYEFFCPEVGTRALPFAKSAEECPPDLALSMYVHLEALTQSQTGTVAPISPPTHCQG